jgi:hypothetical protein
MISLRNITILIGISLLTFCAGCGWATPESKKNSMTGVSESGYPKGQPTDAGSPALGSMRRPEKEKKPAEAK